MKRYLIVGLAGCVAFAGSAHASPFEKESTGPLEGPITRIEVSINPDQIDDRPSTLQLRRGLGPRDWPVSTREAERLTASLTAELEEDLRAQGLYQPSPDERGAVLRVEIEDVAPSQLHITDAGFRAGFRHGSIARGGARLRATVIGPDGEELTTYTYRRYDDLWHAQHALGPYGEAERTFERFSDRVSDDLAEGS